MSHQPFLISFSIDSVRDNDAFRTGAVIDISCSQSSSILRQMSKRKLYNMATEWLLLEEVNSTKAFQKTLDNDVLEELVLLPGSCVTLAQVSRQEGKMKLYDVYRTAPWEPMKYNFLTERFLNATIEYPVRKTAMSFEGVILRAASGVFHPKLFLGWGSLEHTEIDTYAKASYAVIRNVATHLNFSYSLKFLGRYGYQTNGTFDGVVGYLQREEIDLAADAIMMNDDRLYVADFASHIVQIRSPLIFRQPSLSAVSNIFVLPFERTVWLLSVTVTFMFTLALFCNLFLKKKIMRTIETDDSSIPEVLSVTMAYVCRQGTGLELRPGAGRVILCILSMFCFFLSVSFSAKIVALLQSPARTIKTLSDLTNGPMSVGIEDVMYNILIYQNSNDEEFNKLYKKKILPQGDKAILGQVEGIQKVKLGLYAYKAETTWAYKLISKTFEDKEICDLEELNAFFLPIGAMALQKKSGYREHMARSVIWQREAGLMKRTIDIYYPQKPFCNSKSLGYTNVKLTDFKHALDIISYGLILSFILFVLELLLKYRSFFWRILKKCIPYRLRNRRLNNIL